VEDTVAVRGATAKIWDECQCCLNEIRLWYVCMDAGRVCEEGQREELAEY